MVRRIKAHVISIRHKRDQYNQVKVTLDNPLFSTFAERFGAKA